MASVIGQYYLRYQKLIKGQPIVDHLAENPIEGYEPVDDFFLMNQA